MALMSNGSMNVHTSIKKIDYLIEGQEFPFDEDRHVELKGHRSMSVEEIPPSCLRPRSHSRVRGTDERNRFSNKQSRQAVSRTLNAFLNTSHGGSVYLGITDNGIVHGILLTQYQKDHILLSLDDLMNRYSPSVSKEMYGVEFIPVVDRSADESSIQRVLDYKEVVDPKQRSRVHTFRTHKYCWCDTDCQALVSFGTLPLLYVIRINISEWKPSEEDVTKPQVPNVYEDEEGNCYMRTAAGLRSFTLGDLYAVSMRRLTNYYVNELKKLGEKSVKLDEDYEAALFMQRMVKDGVAKKKVLPKTNSIDSDLEENAIKIRQSLIKEGLLCRSLPK